MSFFRPVNCRRPLVASVCLAQALFLCGCIHFIDGYSATSYENLTSLKAYHDKFIEDFTQKSDVRFDAAKLDAADDAGELKFREAIEYAKSLDDELRTDNFTILHEMYQDDVKDLKDSAKLFSPSYGASKLIQIDQAYKLAIKGEKVRTGAGN